MTFLRRAEKKGKRFLNPVPTSVGDLTIMVRLIPLYLGNMAETVPRRPLGPFTTDPGIYQHAPATGLRITWLGHSSMLVEVDGMRILIDPVWDDRASPLSWAGPRRFYPAPLRLKDLPPIDIILISHDHYDHLGAETVRALARDESTTTAKWVTSLGVGGILERFGVQRSQVAELDWTESVVVESRRNSQRLSITAWPARHFSGRKASNRFQTLWSSFVLEGEVHRIYYGADTGWWEGIAEIASRYGGFDLSMLEIGAFNQLWQDIHLGPEGAIRAFRSMGSRGLLMPIHWGLFNLALHGWREPIEQILELASEHNVKLWAPEPGLPSDVHRETALVSRWWQ